jgi:hypothetical protein
MPGAATHPKPMNVPPLPLGYCYVALTLCISGATGLSAQATASPPDKALLKAQLDAREKRADLMLDELRASDDRIEATIDRVLEALRLIGDSKDSRTKVARLKEQTIDGLQKNLAYYQQKRAALQEEMRRPTLHLSAEDKQRAIAKFDARIEKRVQQVLALSKSLPTHKDYERYKAVDSGWYGTNYAPNEDHKQNQRLTAHTNSQREEIVKELQRSIERTDRQTRTLQTQLAAATSGPHRKMLQDEIVKNQNLTKARRAQLAEALTAQGTVTRPVSNKEAQDLDMALRRTIDSLRREFTTLFQRYSSYLTERSNVNAAKAALDAFK